MCLKPCPKGLGQWSLSAGGCEFLSPSQSLSPSPFPVQVPLHIWINPPPSSPFSSWQGARERMEGGRGRGCREQRSERGVEMEGRGVFCGPDFPQCRKLRPYTMSLWEADVWEETQKLYTTRWEVLPPSLTYKDAFKCAYDMHAHDWAYMNVFIFKYIQFHPHSKHTLTMIHTCQSQLSFDWAQWTEPHAPVLLSWERSELMLLWKGFGLGAWKGSSAVKTSPVLCQSALPFPPLHHVCLSIAGLRWDSLKLKP